MSFFKKILMVLLVTVSFLSLTGCVDTYYDGTFLFKNTSKDTVFHATITELVNRHISIQEINSDNSRIDFLNVINYKSTYISRTTYVNPVGYGSTTVFTPEEDETAIYHPGIIEFATVGNDVEVRILTHLNQGITQSVAQSIAEKAQSSVVVASYENIGKIIPTMDAFKNADSIETLVQKITSE